MRATPFVLAAAVVLAAVGPIFSPAHLAFACSCVSTPGPGDLGSSDAVFSGTVLTLGPGFEGGSSAAPRQVTFAVDHVWAGEVPARAIVTTASSGASCGYERFAEGQRFIVYARSRGSAFETNLCQPTRPYDEASVAALQKVAGPGFDVVPAESESPAAAAEDDNTMRWWAAGAIAAALLVGVGAGAWRLRRSR